MGVVEALWQLLRRKGGRDGGVQGGPSLQNDGPGGSGVNPASGELPLELAGEGDDLEVVCGEGVEVPSGLGEVDGESHEVTRGFPESEVVRGELQLVPGKVVPHLLQHLWHREEGDTVH